MKVMDYNSLCSLLARSSLVQHCSVTQTQVTVLTSHSSQCLFQLLNKYSKVREFICHLQQHNLIAEKVVSLGGGLAKAEELQGYCCSGKTL